MHYILKFQTLKNGNWKNDFSVESVTGAQSPIMSYAIAVILRGVIFINLTI